jgi:hypothetical protein
MLFIESANGVAGGIARGLSKTADGTEKTLIYMGWGKNEEIYLGRSRPVFVLRNGNVRPAYQRCSKA